MNACKEYLIGAQKIKNKKNDFLITFASKFNKITVFFSP